MESNTSCEKYVTRVENSPKSIQSRSLSNDLSGKLVIACDSTTNNTQKISAFGYYPVEHMDEEEEEDNYFSEEELLAQMGYGKSKTDREIKEKRQNQFNNEKEAEEDLSGELLLAKMGYIKKEPPKHEPIKTPTAALNLVSALKGSHKSDGKPARECRVLWAPDVYDPPPASDEHLAKTNTERLKTEHKAKDAAGKNRQNTGGIESGGGGGKGSKVGGNKGAVGGGGKAGVKEKDKKQGKKKHGGSAGKYYNLDYY